MLCIILLSIRICKSDRQRSNNNNNNIIENVFAADLVRYLETKTSTVPAMKI